MPDTPTDVLNPVAVEQAIRSVSNRIAASVKVVSDRFEDYRTKDREFDTAYARAYMAHQGPAHERKYAAVLATQNERRARDVAEVAYKYAAGLAEALQDELRAFQSINKALSGIYSAAGTGRI